MNTETITQYLQHLDRLIARVEAQEYVQFEDVLPLRSELREFRARVSGSNTLPPVIKAILETIDLKIEDELLEGSPKTLMLRLYAAIAPTSVHLRAWRAKKRAAMAPEFIRLRSELREVYIAINI